MYEVKSINNQLLNSNKAVPLLQLELKGSEPPTKPVRAIPMLLRYSIRDNCLQLIESTHLLITR